VPAHPKNWCAKSSPVWANGARSKKMTVVTTEENMIFKPPRQLAG
jgi:hypothetical protein